MVPRIMGIVNVTPDSFSDGGRYSAVDAAVDHARTMIAQGATMIDVGGESTRPGAVSVSAEEELARVLPVVEAVADLDAVVSIDTRRARVAREAVAAGAEIINDVSASLWETAAETGAGWIAMHMRGEPGTMQHDPRYTDVVSEVLEFLLERAGLARDAGVSRIWIDPGFGFGKSAVHNLELVAAIDRFVDSGYPVALGVSRKRTLGLLSAMADTTADFDGATEPPAAHVTDADLRRLESLEPTAIDDRLEASLVCAVWAMRAGVDVVRVHDVAPHVTAARTLAEIRLGSAA